MLQNLSFHKKAIIALIIANTIWGAGAPIFKWVLTDVGPFTLAFFRFYLATIILLPFVYTQLHIAKKDIVKVVLFGLSGITINIIFFFLGLQLTSSINAPIITSAGPVFLIFGSFFFLKERPKRKVIIGTTVSLLGVLVIIFRPALEHGFDTAVLGNILFILSTLGMVGHTIILKTIRGKYNPLTLTFWAFLIGTITMLPFFLWETQTNNFFTHLTLRGVGVIWFGAIFSSIIAYILYHYAVEHMSANEVGVFVYLDPIAAILIATPLLGEVVTTLFLLGTFLVFLGVFISEGRLPYHPLHKLRDTS